ncbi:MAG: hypothetical protein NC078_02525, partial [Ruminococcus sp.]|nr:hypothetical protein [Ruminococcus sp.]
MNHSIKFPLPFDLHLGFVIFSVIMLILCFKRRRYAYDLFMLIGIAGTMLIYVAEPKPVFYALGLAEILLLIMTVVDMAIVARRNDAVEKAEKERRERENIEKTEIAEKAIHAHEDDDARLPVPDVTDRADVTGTHKKSSIPDDISEFVYTGGLFDFEETAEKSVGKEVAEILYPYEPEESSEKAVGEEVTEILYPYEPEETAEKAVGEEVAEILYPYEPEETTEKAVAEEVSEILYPYEPEETTEKAVA